MQLADRRELRSRKYAIFAALMGERHQVFSKDATKLLNIVDIVFSDNKRVRDAWADFHNAMHNYKIGQHISGHEADQLRIEVLRRMAEDIGLGQTLTNADFYRSYEPSALFKQRQIEMFQTDRAYEELQRVQDAMAASASVNPVSQGQTGGPAQPQGAQPSSTGPEGPVRDEGGGGP